VQPLPNGIPSMKKSDPTNVLTTKNPSNSLVEALCYEQCYPHPVSRIRVLETHISWVVLTGQYAYKIKKPVNLGFLDFSTLEKRRFSCMEELRLNRRFAPHLYLDVVSITGTTEHPVLDHSGTTIEYAVKMRQFSQHALASRLLAAGKLTPQQLGIFASTLCAFHAAARSARPDDAVGTPQAALDFASQNFAQLLALPGLQDDVTALEALREWSMQEHACKKLVFESRFEAGSVRECHGDLHLGNIVSINGVLTPFDCIEFSPALRWNDVISEVAFLVMDLHDRKHPELAWLFLNAYLERTGDYAAVALLKFFLVYRAMVRAKVHGIRAHQAEVPSAERLRLIAACRGYLDLGAAFAQAARPALIISRGVSGSGKSCVTEVLMQQIGAVRIRSDVERKRRFGLTAETRGSKSINAGMYGERATRELYDHLAQLARETLAAGYTTIIDAAFLKNWQRDLLRELAKCMSVPLFIADITASEPMLRKRVAQRATDGKDVSDADIAVLEHQLSAQEPLTAAERSLAVAISSDDTDPQDCCAPLLEALRRLYA
jgi:aminoglycoside phosphotransferase family enzyme/predicted kinase